MKWTKMNRWSKTLSRLRHPCLVLVQLHPTSCFPTAECLLPLLHAHPWLPLRVRTTTRPYSQLPIHSTSRNSKPHRTHRHPHPPSLHSQADLRHTPLSSNVISRRTYTHILCPHPQHSIDSRPMSRFRSVLTSAYIGCTIIIIHINAGAPYIMYAIYKDR